MNSKTIQSGFTIIYKEKFETEMVLNQAKGGNQGWIYLFEHHYLLLMEI